jgi:hypothetical protein
MNGATDAPLLPEANRTSEWPSTATRTTAERLVDCHVIVVLPTRAGLGDALMKLRVFALATVGLGALVPIAATIISVALTTPTLAIIGSRLDRSRGRCALRDAGVC